MTTHNICLAGPNGPVRVAIDLRSLVALALLASVLLSAAPVNAQAPDSSVAQRADESVPGRWQLDVMPIFLFPLGDFSENTGKNIGYGFGVHIAFRLADRPLLVGGFGRAF